MKITSRFFLSGPATFLCWFALTLAGFAEEANPPPPPASADQPAAAEAPKAPTPPPEPSAPTPPNDPELRRLDGETSAATPAPTETPAVEQEKKKDDSKARRSRSTRVIRGSQNKDDKVIFFDDNIVRKDDTVLGDAVAIMGDVRIDGEVRGDVIGAFGDVSINGTVDGGVGSILGDITLGSNARVKGDVIVYGPGEIRRHSDAVVEGKVEVRSGGRDDVHLPASAAAWWSQALRLGRPLAIGPHLGFLWILTALAIGFYALLALVFPGSIRRCGDTLIQRPALTVLSALLGIISLPVLIVLLVITVVGILLIPFIPFTVVLFVLFGKAAICALIGRAISKDQLHPALATVVGGMLLVLFYLLPVVGLLLSTLVGFLGFGCVICSMLTTSPRPAVGPTHPISGVTPPANPPPAPSASAAMMHEPTVAAPVQSPGFGTPMAAAVAAAAAATPPGFVSPPVVQVTPPAEASTFQTPLPSQAASVPPPSPSPASPPPAFIPPPPPANPFVNQPVEPPFSAVGLPRVGFWLRLGALMIDLLLIGVICGPIGLGEMVPVAIAVYAAAMWKTKGTTIGGIICDLRVVRLDDRPLDWPTAVVRALGCFVSLIVAGLGFIWVAFDDQKQSWHDKIAGTTVVRVRKPAPLI